MLCLNGHVYQVSTFMNPRNYQVSSYITYEKITVVGEDLLWGGVCPDLIKSSDGRGGGRFVKSWRRASGFVTNILKIKHAVNSTGELICGYPDPEPGGGGGLLFD